MANHGGGATQPALTPTLITRKNQASLSSQEWQALIEAINGLHGVTAAPPTYRQFVQVHVDAMSPTGMAWSVHSMPGMRGRNFLAWHRRYIAQLERRLQQVNSAVSLPYWDWIANPEIPEALDDSDLLTSWSVTRSWDPAELPSQADLDAVNLRTTFTSFQSALEGVHGAVHNAVGGTMAGSSSPADPLFFLHHANVDRLWALWQASPAGVPPPNLNETLQPPPLFGIKVSKLVNIADVGYKYV